MGRKYMHPKLVWTNLRSFHDSREKALNENNPFKFTQRGNNSDYDNTSVVHPGMNS